MAKKRRRFTTEFKLEAVKMVVEQGRSVRSVADGLGISDTIVYRWMKKHVADGRVAEAGNGKLSPKDEEIKRLKRELAIARQERDILKKAAAYFAKDES